MPDQIYEVVSQGARYWFLFLMALIAWRSYRWLVRDRKQRKKRLKLLPDAGYVGELVVIRGNAELPEGIALPVSGEGILGRLRGNDVYVPVRGVLKKHLWYEFDDEQGLRVQPYGRRTIEVDGKTCTGRRAHAYMTHGSRLTVGDAELRLRMFAGYEYVGVKHAPPLDDEETQEEMESVTAQPTPPPGTIAFTPQQLAAFQQMQQMQQMQWMAAWQAMQAQNAQAGPQPGAAVTPNMTQPVGVDAPPVPTVLSTGAGEFLAPPKKAVAGSILPSTDAGEGEPETVADGQARAHAEPSLTRVQRHQRHNPLPPIDSATVAAPETDAWTGENAGEYPAEGFAPDGPTADVLWERSRADERDGSLRRVPDVFSNDTDTLTPVTDGTFAPRVTFYPPVLDEEPAPYAGMPEGNAAGLSGGETDGVWPYAAYPQSNAHFTNSGYTYPEYVEPDAADEPYEYADEDEAPRSLYVEPDEAAQAKRVLWDRYLKGGGRR